MTDSTNASAPLTEAEVAAHAAKARAVVDSLSAVVLGQPEAVTDLVVALLADGHALLEGVPGVAKTLLARALAAAVGVQFTRVQFTPDLMPADLLGTRVFDPERREWELHQGPVFTEVLLADEINRSPPKTQAALLEAMEERQVTLDGERRELSPAFFVVATENPLEFEGTYPLPEAQTDRFLLKIEMGYPSEDAELALLQNARARGADRIGKGGAVLDRAALLDLRAAVRRVRVDDDVSRYALRLLHATRRSESLKLGASPRSGLMLLGAAQACALLEGRGFVIPDDVKGIATAVFRHRLALSTEAELDGLNIDEVLRGLLDSVPVREGG